MKNRLRDVLAASLVVFAAILALEFATPKPVTGAATETLGGRCCPDCLSRQAEDEESLDVRMRSRTAQDAREGP